jgi:hypothetical protein
VSQLGETVCRGSGAVGRRQAPAVEAEVGVAQEGRRSERVMPSAVEEWLIGLDRRVEATDVSMELAATALAWLVGYQGGLPWLLAQQERCRRDAALPARAVVGVLNCWRADLLSRRRALHPELGVDVHSLIGGCYAVRHDDGHVVFYRVEHGRARWAGWTFLDQVIGGGRSQRLGKVPPGRWYRGRRRADVHVIAQDPEAAAQLFGRELGICGMCGRRLTDDASRAAGIGPICQRRWDRVRTATKRRTPS